MIAVVTADCEGLPVRMLVKAGVVYAVAKDLGRLSIGTRGEHAAITSGLRAVPHEHKTLLKHLIAGEAKPQIKLRDDAFVVSQPAWRAFSIGLGLHDQRANAIGLMLDDHAAKLRIAAMSVSAVPRAVADDASKLAEAVRYLADMVRRQQEQIEALTQNRAPPLAGIPDPQIRSAYRPSH